MAFMLDKEEKNAALSKRSVYGFTSASEAEDQRANTGFCTLSLYFFLDTAYNSSH
jgi:hypothetical protein